MKIVEPGFEILTIVDEVTIMKRLETIGRIAYKSENNITDDSYTKFINIIMSKKHYSVLEHVSISVKIICDRGVSHEWVRHRIASYTQESTRYCNYSKDKFGRELTFIKPKFDNYIAEKIWMNTMEVIESAYMAMLDNKVSPQFARSILPTSVKTEFVVTKNLRAWLNFFSLRTMPDVHPQMLEITTKLFIEFNRLLPLIFKIEGK